MRDYEVRVSHTHVYTVKAKDSEQAVKDVINGSGKEEDVGTRWTTINTEELHPFTGGSNEDSE